jgi:hypothetical protein
MAASYPKPESERQTRHQPKFDWTDLPAVNTNPVPPMPDEVRWTQTGIDLWEKLWHSPQSTQWPKEYYTAVVRYVALYERMMHQQDLSGPVTNAMTQLEDRLGISPKSMLQLRWRIRPGQPDADGLAVVKEMKPDRPRPKRPDPRG